MVRCSELPEVTIEYSCVHETLQVVTVFMTLFFHKEKKLPYLALVWKIILKSEHNRGLLTGFTARSWLMCKHQSAAMFYSVDALESLVRTFNPRPPPTLAS